MANLNVCLDALKTCAVSADYVDWFTIITAVLLTVVAALSILFLVSRALGRKDWEAFARAEYYQTGIAAVWVVIIASTATAACSISCMVVDEDSPFLAASSFVADTRAKLQKISNELFELAQDIKISFFDLEY